MVDRDPNRNSKRHLGFWPSIAIIVLLLAVAFAPWAAPSLPYR